MENDQFHEKVNASSLEGDAHCNADTGGMQGPFGEQSTVDPLFSSLIENAMFPLLIVSVENESILYANKYAQDYFGRCELGHGLKLAKDYWADASSRKEFLKKILIEKEVKDFKAILVTAQNKRRHVLLSSRLIRYKSQQAIYTIFTDITERVKAQNAYRK